MGADHIVMIVIGLMGAALGFYTYTAAKSHSRNGKGHTRDTRK